MMTFQTGVPLLAVALVAQGFFSGSEMAMVSANRAKLKVEADNGSRGAQLALQMLAHEEQVFGTCLLGTNIALFSGTSIVAAMLLSVGHEEEWLVALCYVPLGLFFGEALPKTLYRHWADTLAPILAYPIRGVQLALWPVLWVLAKWSDLLGRLLRSDHASEGMKREDIVQMLDDKHAHHIDAEERAFIRRLLSMHETTVEEAMTPLVDVTAISEELTVARAIEVVLREGHSRMPVYRERVDNIQGQVHHRDLLFCADDAKRVGDVMRPVRFVPETKPVDDLLREMREASDPFAVVVDEYGGSTGIVTSEDLLELVVGDIQDEGDANAPTIRKLGDKEWRVPARVEIDELEAAIGRSVPEGDYETVAGLLLSATGRIPATGETVVVGTLRFTVEAASERAVNVVRVTIE
jgi:putative hemolysin